MNPQVSILISIHNGSQTLDRCFESIQKQTFQDFEIVCVNDGSTDQTSEIIKKWQSIFGQDTMKLLNNNPNIGFTKSLNQGLDLANGQYTARIDADDFWHAEKLEKQIKFLEENKEYGIVGCNYINISPNKEVKISLKKTDAEIKKSIIKRNPFAHSCVVFDTALIKKVGGYDKNILYGQDYDLWLRCVPRTKFYNLSEFLCYRSIGQGISVEKQRSQMWQSIKTQVKYIKEYHYSWINYLYLLEPLTVIVLPKFIKDLKRRLL
ncbi:MAG TPA: glycosyltransferase [Patescibacteria group bacterium]|nr:glycosyltransferase [Patescibacteria group bacterium]